MMTRTLAIYALIATTVLATTILLVIAALLARADNPDGDDWADDDLDAMYDDDLDAMYDDDLERDLQADAEEYDQRLHLADGWAQQLTPPEVPQLDPCAARPYIDYVPRHGDDTIEFHLVPAGWIPAIGAARIAALATDTQRLQAVR